MWLIYCSCFQEKYWGLSRLTQLARRSIVVVVSQSYLYYKAIPGGNGLLSWRATATEDVCDVQLWGRGGRSLLHCEESLHLGFLLVRYFLADAKLSQWDVNLLCSWQRVKVKKEWRRQQNSLSHSIWWKIWKEQNNQYWEGRARALCQSRCLSWTYFSFGFMKSLLLLLFFSGEFAIMLVIFEGSYFLVQGEGWLFWTIGGVPFISLCFVYCVCTWVHQPFWCFREISYKK